MVYTSVYSIFIDYFKLILEYPGLVVARDAGPYAQIWQLYKRQAEPYFGVLINILLCTCEVRYYTAPVDEQDSKRM